MASFYLVAIVDTLSVPLSQNAKITNTEKFEYTPVLDPSDNMGNCEDVNDITAPVIPNDYIEHSNRLKATVFAQRLGLSLANGVDRLIFKNHDFAQFFDPKYLFNKGYFGSVEEYENLVDCANTKNLVLFPPIKTPEIYAGTRVLVIIGLSKEDSKKLKTSAQTTVLAEAYNNTIGQQKGGYDYQKEFEREFELVDDADWIEGGDLTELDYIEGGGVDSIASKIKNSIKGTKRTFVGRVVDVCNKEDGKYYKIEYQYDVPNTKEEKKEEKEETVKEKSLFGTLGKTLTDAGKTLKKGASEFVKVGEKLAGMKEQAEIEPLYSDFEKGIKGESKPPDTKKPEEEKKDGVPIPEIKHRGLPHNPIPTLIPPPPSEYKVLDKWIHEDFVYKERVFRSSKNFMRMNDEVNIPFRNPAIFPVFHMIKYSYGKMFNFGRINLIWHMVNALQKSMKPYENTINEIVILGPMDNILMKNVLKADNPKAASQVNKISNDEVNRQNKEEEKENAEEKGKESKTGGRTAKNRHTNHNKTQKKQKGGLNFSGTIKGDIGVIIDKIGKYMYCKNLRLIHGHEEGLAGKAFKSIVGSAEPKENEYAKFAIPNTHVMYYVEEEQRRFLGLAIMYFTDVENRDHNNSIFMEPYPFVNYFDIGIENMYNNSTPEEPYNLNNTIDSFLQNEYSGKSTYELVKILADFVWPERQHFVDTVTKGGDLSIRRGLSAAAKAVSKTASVVKHAVRKGTNVGIQAVGELAAKNNMVLNKLFDYSFKRMVYYRLIDMHRSVFTVDGKFEPPAKLNRTTNSQRITENMLEMCKFYLKLKFVFIRGAHFPCSSALNIISGFTSNPVATFVQGLLPEVLAPFIQVNTPQCYCACIICAFGLFSMYPYPSTYVKIYTKKLLGMNVASQPGQSFEDMIINSNREKVVKYVQDRKYKGFATLEEVPADMSFYIVDLEQEKVLLSDKKNNVEEYKKWFKEDREKENDPIKYKTGTMSDHPYFIVTDEVLDESAISGETSQMTGIQSIPEPNPAPSGASSSEPNPAPSPALSPEPNPASSPEPNPALSPAPSPALSPEPSRAPSPAPSPTPSPAPSLKRNQQYRIVYMKNETPYKYMLAEQSTNSGQTGFIDIIFKYNNTVVTHEDVRKFMKIYDDYGRGTNNHTVVTGFDIYDSTGQHKLLGMENESVNQNYKISDSQKTIDFHTFIDNYIAYTKLKQLISDIDSAEKFAKQYNATVTDDNLKVFFKNFTFQFEINKTQNFINALNFYIEPYQVKEFNIVDNYIQLNGNKSVVLGKYISFTPCTDDDRNGINTKNDLLDTEFVDSIILNFEQRPYMKFEKKEVLFNSFFANNTNVDTDIVYKILKADNINDIPEEVILSLNIYKKK